MDEWTQCPKCAAIPMQRQGALVICKSCGYRSPLNSRSKKMTINRLRKMRREREK